MAVNRHSYRNGRGQFARIHPETDLEPVNVSGAPSPNTKTHARYAPQGDELAQGGNMCLIRRSPIQIDAQSGGSLGAHITDVRAADVYVGGQRTAGHLRAAGDDEFAGFLMGKSNVEAPDLRPIAHRARPASAHQVQHGIESGARTDPLQPKREPGKKLRPMGPADRDAELRG